VPAAREGEVATAPKAPPNPQFAGQRDGDDDGCYGET